MKPTGYQRSIKGQFDHKSAIKSFEPSKTANDFDGVEQYYALAPSDQNNTRFKVILSSGDLFSVPYSLLPTIHLKGNKELEVLTHDIKLRIRGRGLSIIEEHLSSEAIIWLKESASGTDLEEESCFIQSIEVSGNLFED